MKYIDDYLRIEKIFNRKYEEKEYKLKYIPRDYYSEDSDSNTNIKTINIKNYDDEDSCS